MTFSLKMRDSVAKSEFILLAYSAVLTLRAQVDGNVASGRVILE